MSPDDAYKNDHLSDALRYTAMQRTYLDGLFPPGPPPDRRLRTRVRRRLQS